MKNNIDFEFKIVLSGNSGVGKTNLIQRYIKNKFNEELNSTVGIDFEQKTIKLNDKNIKVKLWDTAGQERMKSVASLFYKNSEGAVFVYDITDRNSFKKIITWITELKKHVTDQEGKMILVGNKSDLTLERKVAVEEGIKLSKKLNCFFMETSAKTNVDMCVNKAIDHLVKQILEDKMKVSLIEEKINGVQLDQNNRVELTAKSDGQCC